MKSIAKKLTAVLSLGLAAQLSAGPAAAAPPASLVNSTWSLLADGVSETLHIATQGNLGTCKVIHGTLGNVGVPIDGFYCPADGRIHFIHKNLTTKVPMRVFDGIVWNTVAGQPYQMSGSYTSDYSAVKAFGYYGFYAIKL